MERRTDRSVWHVAAIAAATFIVITILAGSITGSEVTAIAAQ